MLRTPSFLLHYRRRGDACKEGSGGGVSTLSKQKGGTNGKRGQTERGGRGERGSGRSRGVTKKGQRTTPAVRAHRGGFFHSCGPAGHGGSRGAGCPPYRKTPLRGGGGTLRAAPRGETDLSRGPLRGELPREHLFFFCGEGGIVPFKRLGVRLRGKVARRVAVHARNAFEITGL